MTFRSSPPPFVDAPASVHATSPASDERTNFYLHPGELITTAASCRITTILGSCVAVALHDPLRLVGGMNHYLLPQGPQGSSSARFGTVALPQLLEALLSQGGTKRDLQAKVFGGASIFGPSTRQRNLGHENVALALAFLEAERIPVLAEHTGGTRGRKLIFSARDGAVWLKSL